MALLGAHHIIHVSRIRVKIIIRHTTLGRNPLDESSARHRDFYLTTNNNHKRQTSMHPMGFEPAIAESERPKNHVVDRAVIGITAEKYIECKLYVSMQIRTG